MRLLPPSPNYLLCEVLFMKMLLFAGRSAVLAGSLLLAISAPAQVRMDDSPWLNQNIRDAINSGRPSYTIPAGTYYLWNPLIVPRGTKNFALLGSGQGQTILRAPFARQRLVEVGEAIMPHNNWGLTDKTNTVLEPLDEGATVLRLVPGADPVAPGNYVLWDDHQIVNRYGTGETHNRAEIVRVISYDPLSRSATLDEPVGRDFLNSPKLANFNQALCENITVGNITIDGLSDTGVGSTDMLYISGVRGLNVSNVRLVNYANGASYINVCKNSTVTNCVIDPATTGGIGAGYGLTITRSRFTTIQNCQLNSSQALKFHTGAMDSTVQDCVTTSGGNAIDAHGFDELRVTIRRCTGNGGITLGNEAWAAGGKGHRVEDCDLQFLFIGPNATDVIVRRSKFREALSLSDLDPSLCNPLANPMGGRPGVISFEDCEFWAAQNVVNDFRWFNCERVVFSRCILGTTNTSFGNVIKLVGGRGNLAFYGCEFRPAANREAIELATGTGNSLSLTMSGCTIRSEVGLNVGVWLQNPYQGKLLIVNNQLVSRNAPLDSVFLKNDSRAKGTVRGNVVIRP
jgi:hypothetical protein